MANEKPPKPPQARKVRITGNVIGGDGAMKGVRVLPKKEAERLVRLGVAEFAGKDESEAPGTATEETEE